MTFTAMLQRLRSVLKPKRTPATQSELSITTMPIEVNPSQRAAMQRHAGRLANLYGAQERGDSRSEIPREITMRLEALGTAGLPRPENAEAARALLNRLRDA